jgi:quercetin dioxygenase-like cupin family protein
MSDDRLRPSPELRFDASSQVFDLPVELASLRSEGPSKHGHRQKTLFKHAGRTIALFAMDAGAGLPEHHAAGPVSIQVVEGTLVVTIDGQPQTLEPGQVMVLATNLRHAVRADAAAAFLLQISLAPS